MGKQEEEKKRMMRRSSEEEDWSELEWKSDRWQAVAVLKSPKERW